MIPDKMLSKVLNAIDQHELTRLTSDLVRINSVWDPSAGTNEQAVADWVAGWAESQGFQVEADVVAPGRPNLNITWETLPGDRVLLFEGHADVVTPGDISAWTHDPFGAEIVGRRMYGRGTNDTKGNLAAMLMAMAAIKRSGVPLPGKIIGAVLCDEEDRMLGVQDFIARGRADSVTGAVICEPQDGLICTSQKGAIRVQYTITGRMSHGAMPLSGLNTAPALATLIDGLNALEREAMENVGRDEYLGWPSFTPTVIQAPMAGSLQLNVMPRTACVLVDIRTVPNQSHGEIVEKVKRLANQVEEKIKRFYVSYDRLAGIERSHDLSIAVEFLTDRPCTQTAKNEGIVRSAEWASHRITGKAPEYGGVLGSTDGTYLWAHKRIPIVTMGAGDRYVAHQVDEWVNLDQLFDTAKVYALIALHYLHPGSTDG